MSQINFLFGGNYFWIYPFVAFLFLNPLHIGLDFDFCVRHEVLMRGEGHPPLDSLESLIPKGKGAQGVQPPPPHKLLLPYSIDWHQYENPQDGI